MPLIIQTGRLRDKPETLCGEEPNASLALEFGESVTPRGPLKYDLRVQLISGELIVRGRLSIAITGRCARCGDDFEGKIGISDFFRSFTLKSQNELINLTQDVREDILLALPMVVLCSADCRGLCPGCGANLNREKCKCKRPPGANVWNALDDLRLK